MKLAVKIALALVIGASLFLTLDARARIAAATARYEADMREDALDVGRLFRPAIARAWRTDGEAAALYIVDYTNETLKNEDIFTRMHLRWVWLHKDAEESLQPEVPFEAIQDAFEGKETSVIYLPPRRNQDHGFDREMVRKKGGAPWRYSYVPVSVGIDGAPLGALEIAESTESLSEYADSARDKFIYNAIILALLTAFAVSVVGFWFVGRPMQTLTRAAETIGDGDLDTRIDLKQRDEIGSLAKVMNSMAKKLKIAREESASEHEGKLRAIQQLRHADRLSSVGTFASGIAHELGTPLAIVSGRAKLVADGKVKEEEISEYAKSIHKQADRMAKIIRQLLDFARRSPMAARSKKIGEILDPTFALLKPLATENSVKIVTKLSGKDLFVKADSSSLQQVFTNLVVNAIDAMPNGGTVTIKAKKETAVPPADVDSDIEHFICCTVEDTGQGIRPETLPDLFEPFFTTKGVGKGTGLGLAVSYGIVSEHGGWIDVETQLGTGTKFSVFLPDDEFASPQSD